MLLIACIIVGAGVLHWLWRRADAWHAMPEPLYDIVRVLIWLVAIVAILWKAVPLVRALGV